MNYSEMNWLDRLVYSVAKFFVAIGIDILHHLRVAGRGHLPRKGPYIVIANHISMWDVFFISRMLFPLRTVYMAKEELFRSAIARWAIGIAGGYPVKRGSADIGAIKKALSVLKEGQVFGIFPEGTRNRKWDGTLQKFFNGVGYIALLSRVPVVPVFFADKNGYKPFRPVKVFVGEPVDLSDLLQGKVTSEITERATTRILASFDALMEAGLKSA